MNSDPWVEFLGPFPVPEVRWEESVVWEWDWIVAVFREYTNKLEEIHTMATATTTTSKLPSLRQDLAVIQTMAEACLECKREKERTLE